MKISELITILQSLPPDMPVYRGIFSGIRDIDPHKHLLIGAMRNEADTEHWEGLIIPDYEFPVQAVSGIDKWGNGGFASKVFVYTPEPVYEWDNE